MSLNPLPTETRRMQGEADETRPSSTLIVHGLSCRLGQNDILKGLSLPDLHGGELVALLGPNGSGKSTLLRSISGFVRANSQALRLNDHNLQAMGARERAGLLRYLPQSLPEAVHLTVTEAVLVALRARESIPTLHALKIAGEVLDDLGIAHLADRYLDELSGGQKQLVGLAQALSKQPQVLLLDEPISSLDLNYQHHVMRLLARLSRSLHLLIIIVLHDLNIALRYADRALLLHNGELLAGGLPQAVVTSDNLARAFHVQARVEHCGDGRASVFVDDLIRL